MLHLVLSFFFFCYQVGLHNRTFAEMKLNFPLQLYLAKRLLAKESRHSGVGVSGERENIM